MSSKTDDFSKAINQYLNYTKMPWGELFYLTAWHQITNFIEVNNQLILDVGCGFGITALEFAKKGNQVTGIDPTSEMIEIARDSAINQEVHIDFRTETLNENNHFNKYDWIFSHNILEYVDEPFEYLKSVSNLQKDNGYLSLIAHNPTAKVMKKAIISKNPNDALHSIGNNKEYSTIIQTDITTYTYETLIEWLEETGYEVLNRFGIHNIYGYVADNDIKQNEEWHKQTVTLELELGNLSPYKDIAIFTHLIAQKTI